MVSYILGTAGHIDHGKSALIQALTGVDPDRLPEEKRRGVTIELGFAQLTLPDGTVLGVVDVPGHEKFVRQMVAGSSGFDIALLVVAADDGVMVQTREHVRVLQLMGITHLVVALSKCDMVDDEWRALVTLDIVEVLARHGYEDVPIIETSTVTGEGLDALVAALELQVATIEDKASSETLRLPVDRVFTIEGAGCVVTGTLWSGVARIGDTVEILPSEKEARIRGIQVHSAPVQKAYAGQRVALNLAGIEHTQIERGDTVASPRTMMMTRRFDAALTYLGPDEGNVPLKSGARVHIHHAATTTLGRVILFDEATLAPHTEAFVQIRLETPIAAQYLDRFIIRSYSPTYTIGGGTILVPQASKRSSLHEEERSFLSALYEGDLADAVQGYMNLSHLPHTSAELALKLGVARAKVAALLNESDFERIKIANETSFITAAGAQRIREGIERALLAFHEDHPQEIDMSIATLRERSAGYLDAEIFDALLSQLEGQKTVTCNAGRVRHDHAPQTAQLERLALANQALPLLVGQGLAPDSLADLSARLNTSKKVLSNALAPHVDVGKLVRLAGDLYFSQEAIEHGADQIRHYYQTEIDPGAGATAAQLRDALGVSRKYAIPLLEYYDRSALTRREGDLRYLK
ncbi:MAG: selenocysteine-specific translation elongation factor [Actinomycetia bacterium]|nr:selenocysteine-specific translation elongation factor [Actinomycetes bacterium]